MDAGSRSIGMYKAYLITVVAVSLGALLSACNRYGSSEPDCGPGEVAYRDGCATALLSTHIVPTRALDLLFVVDNGGSMVAEQHLLAESFHILLDKLDETFRDDYHIAVITHSMESAGCPPCNQTITSSCMNETGETGRFQDRLGKNEGTIEMPQYTFRTDATCRIMTSHNARTCFYDRDTGEGVALVGINGCGYDRGLAAIRAALGDLTDTYNAGFLREAATLGIVVLSTEDDCGEVGDISEGIPGAMGIICYYAAKGVGPEGETTHPQDPDARPYALTPVQDYLDFLLGLKHGRRGMVKLAAIVGVEDVSDPTSTTIEYEREGDRWSIVDACTIPDCPWTYCSVYPGTRYIELARLLGLGHNGLVDTVCQTDYTDTMERIGDFLACPAAYPLSAPLTDPDRAAVLINGEEVPRHSCAHPGPLEPCAGPGSPGCSEGDCTETWTYHPPADPPDPFARHGTISFADHDDPCRVFGNGVQVRIDLVLVPVESGGN